MMDTQEDASSREEEAQQAPLYKLSATLVGHTGDVRGSCANYPDAEVPFVATASRDGKGKLWAQVAPNEYAHMADMEGHTRYLMAITCLPPTQTYPQGLLLTGSLDATILVWDPAAVAGPIAKLEGHKNAVCCLSVISPTSFLSTSWDSTARVWDVDTRSCTSTLEGHEASVISGCYDSFSESIFTGSADKTLCKWEMTSPAAGYTKTLQANAHSDVIRAVVSVSEACIASSSNDSTIKLWTKDFLCIAEFTGHSAFVYSLCTIPSTSLLASCGEDGCVKVWDLERSVCIQTLDLPCTSVWNVACRYDGDLLVSGDDATLRIFSTSPDRQASTLALAQYDELVQAAVASKQAQTIGALKKSDVPDASALQQPGKQVGENKIVQNKGKVEAYTWTGAEWQLTGVVTDAIKADYTFTVDLEDRNLKLEYNNGENPYAVAQEFIHKHELSQGYLDEIAKFIMQNANVPTIEAADPNKPSNPDPFTGSRSHHTQPSHHSQSSSTSSSSNSYHQSFNPDPFTGRSKAANFSSSSSSSRVAKPSHPLKSASQGLSVKFASGKPEQALKAFESKNAGKEGEACIPAAKMSLLAEFVTSFTTFSNEQKLSDVLSTLLKALEDWDVADWVPVLDLLRLSFVAPAASSVLAQRQREQPLFSEHLVTICTGCDSGHQFLFGMRALTNALFAAPTLFSAADHLKICLFLLEINMASLKDPALLAIASYLQNAALWLQTQSAMSDAIAEAEAAVLSALHHLLVVRAQHTNTVVRMLTAIDTLMSRSEVLTMTAKELADFQSVVESYISSQTPSISNLAKAVSKRMSNC